jgi:hypothetical protein
LFLEGGVGWAANLLTDLVEHWAKRSRSAMLTYYAPANLAKDEARELIRKYGESTFRDHLEEMCRDDMLSALEPGKTLEELTEDLTEFDFDALDVSSTQELREIFRTSFAFGCEADDPMTKLAFDPSITKTRLQAVLGSDIGHFDVTDMSQVLVEAFELVDDGLIDEAAFKEFTYTNIANIQTHLNAAMFDGTIIEQAARQDFVQSPIA